MRTSKMRREIELKKGWVFTGRDGKAVKVDLPHTWNAVDGQDGGNDYYRGTCHYSTTFAAPDFDSKTQRVYLEFQGVNSSAEVELNGQKVMSHDGGYSTFRADVTEFLTKENKLEVAVDNSVNDRVYPQKADFTFYGGIYRDVLLRIVSNEHFEMDYYGGDGVMVTPTVEGKDGKVHVESFHKAENAKVAVTLIDAQGNPVAKGEGKDVTVTIPDVHLWDGVEDPYLYTAVVELMKDGEVKDDVRIPFGVRTFSVDPKKGFFLNGRSYPLHGVSRHQDRKGIGNALTKEHHREDMEFIREIGANTVRLAHYQHDQYFYDLCDQYGMIVWAEIPYISEHMPNGRENTISQMKELIVQNYNHPSIVTWGISNEITISTKDNKDMLDNHRELNDLCHKMDSIRPTTLACYAVCGPFNKVAHLSDLVSWNLYLGWYVPGLFLNDWWISFFHRFNCVIQSISKQCIQIYRIHKSQQRSICHTVDMNPAIFTDQTFFCQNGIQNFISCSHNSTVDLHGFFNFFEICFPLFFIFDSTYRLYLMLQIMTFVIDQLYRLFGQLILPFLLMPEKLNGFQLFSHTALFKQCTLQIQ